MTACGTFHVAWARLRHVRMFRSTLPIGGRPDSFCSLRGLPVLTDAVEKVWKCPVAIFSKEAQLNHPRRLNMAPRPLSKSPVSFSLGGEVLHIVIRESHQRPREIVISGGKRLFQQHRPEVGIDAVRSPLGVLSLLTATALSSGPSLPTFLDQEPDN